MNQKLSIFDPLPKSPAGKRLGSWLSAEGVAFGVWAPNAESVSVIGSFNGWNDRSNRLVRDEGGWWFTQIADASVGDEYRYRIVYGGDTFDRIDPRARKVTHSQGNSVVYDQCFDWSSDHFSLAPLNELVFYEMHIGSFTGSRASPGTFDSAIKRLGYLSELGINAIQLMPVVEFPGERSWGYEPSHPFAVESSYGGPDAFKRFVRAAHREGIAVFQDVIYNHFGPSDLHLWRFDGWFENERGGIYFYQDDRADSPWGARPNYERREVREYLLDNALMWFDEYHVDGLRVDGTYFIRTAGKHEAEKAPPLEAGWSLLCELTNRVKTRFPHAVLVAEDMRGDERITKPIAEGGAGFDLQWSDRLSHAARVRVTDPEQREKAQEQIAGVIRQRFNQKPFQRVIYVESHDNAGKGERLLTTADPNNPEGSLPRNWLKLATVAVFTSLGTPLIFQGQEMLSYEGFELSDIQPLDWSRTKEHKDVVDFHRELIQLRLNRHGFAKGLQGDNLKVIHQVLVTGILVWRRWANGGPGDDVIVVTNFSERSHEDYHIGVPEPGAWYVRLRTAQTEAGHAGATQLPPIVAVPAESSLRDDFKAQISIQIGPLEGLILSQNSRDNGKQG